MPRKTGTKHATTRQRIAILDLLREHLNPPGQDGLVAYKEGWNDDRIAREVGLPTYSAVRHMRQEAFGSLISSRASEKAAPSSTERLVAILDSAVASLQVRLAAIEEQVAALMVFRAELEGGPPPILPPSGPPPPRHAVGLFASPPVRR